jgi:hypothetical protein
MFLYNQFIGSYVNDILHTSQSRNIIDIINYIDHMRLHETIDSFMLTKKITDNASNQHYINLINTLKLPSECVRRHFHIETVHERMLPPVEVITRQHYNMWMQENNYTPELYQSKRHHLYSFYNSLIPCICIIELHRLTPLDLRLNYENKRVRSLKILRVRCRIPENFNVVLYNDEFGEQRGLSFNVEYDAEHNLFFGFNILKATLETDETMYVNPSIYFISNGKNREMVIQELPSDYEVLDELDEFVTSNLTKYTRIVSAVESNIHSCWTTDPEKLYPTTPNTKVIGSDFTNSVIFCVDLPNDTLVEEFKAPQGITRLQGHSIIQVTKEKHLNHICVRNRTSNCVVSITFTPSQTYCVLYITTLFKIGTRCKVGHLAIVTKNRKAFHDFIQNHWNEETNWIDEEYFSQLTVRFHRNLSSSSNVFLPLPVGRVFMNEPFSCDLITRGLWKLYNCFCYHCKDVREQTTMCV